MTKYQNNNVLHINKILNLLNEDLHDETIRTKIKLFSAIETWRLVCLSNDILCASDITNIETHLNEYEKQYFSQYDDAVSSFTQNSNNVSLIDATVLLGINTDKGVGMICPSCSQRDTTYKLFASRSADEGMTAICNCRRCKNQWSIKM